MVGTPTREAQLKALREEVHGTIPPREALDEFLEKHSEDILLKDTIIALKSAANLGAMFQIAKEFTGTRAQSEIVNKCVKHMVNESGVTNDLAKLTSLERSADRSGFSSSLSA